MNGGEAQRASAPPWLWPDLAIGVTLVAVDAGVALAGAARQAFVRTVSNGPDRATRLGEHTRDRIAGIAGRGTAQRTRSTRWVATLVDAVVASAATSPMMNRVVDLQINRVLPPLVGSVLDDILALLEAEPERVRSLVRGQREGIVDDVVAHIRSGATAGDATADRWTARILRRATVPDVPPTPDDGPARAPVPP